MTNKSAPIKAISKQVIKGFQILALALLPAIIIFLSSCEKKEKIEFALEKEKMVKILVDLHFAEAAMQNMTALIKDSLVIEYYKQIFEIHGVEESVFRADMAKLRASPEKTQEYYEEVMEYINNNELAK